MAMALATLGFQIGPALHPLHAPAPSNSNSGSCPAQYLKVGRNSIQMATAAISSHRTPAFTSTVETGKPIPSILEEWERLRKVDADEFPKKFIEREEDRPDVKYNEWCETAQIPVIDLSRVETDRAGVAKQLTEAATDWGFFQLVNHGLSLEFLQELERQSFSFFELPVETKQKAGQAYVGDSTTDKPSSLNWAECLRLKSVDGVNKVASEVWQDGSTEFRDVCSKHIEAVDAMNRQLLELFGEGLNLGTDFFAQHLNSMRSLALRWNFYPACPLPTQVLGSKPHTDGCSLTILYQSGIGGLQIQKDGRWLAVKPTNGALVVNIGDALHAWTNGLFKTIMHRAVVNDSVHRLSIAAFMNVDSTLQISAPDELVDENHPRLFRPYTFGDYLSHTFKVREEDPDISRNGLYLLEGFKLQK